jgi:hypothetical protein
VTFHNAERTVAGRTQNVSRGGLCAIANAALQVGKDCEVSIVLIFEDDVQSEPLRLPARAVWSTMVDDEHQVGIMFKALDAKHSQYLAVFLQHLDGQHTETRPADVSIDDRFR